MQDDSTAPDKAGSETPAVDWAGLRAEAEKLGISLSALQQREREKKMRLARKNQSRAAATAESTPEKQ
jgi:hypothetical protein